MESFEEWMQLFNIVEIALLKINIEGGEYDLLDELIASGIIGRIRNIQVQFHDFIEESDDRMAEITNRLSATHKTTFSYRYVWDNWERKDSAENPISQVR